MSVCFLVCLIITCKPFNRFGSEENVRTTAHSCMPSPLAPDPIRVQPCVWCLFWTNRKLHCGNIYLAYPKQSYLHAGSTSKALKVFKMSNYITKKIKSRVNWNWSGCYNQISDFFLLRKFGVVWVFIDLRGVEIWQHIHPSSFIWIHPVRASFLLSRKHAQFRCERCWQPPLCPPTSFRWS